MLFRKKITDLLLKAGLSETEALVYNELLKKPADSIYDLVRRTGVSKSSAYRAVDYLKNRGIISEKNKTITAKSPKNATTPLNNSKRKLGKIAELKFYKKLLLPVPRKCPDQRSKERLLRRKR